MDSSTTEKVREHRLRRMAARRGLALQKSRRRDPRAIGYGRYNLLNVRLNALAASAGDHGLTLDEVEDELTGGKR